MARENSLPGGTGLKGFLVGALREMMEVTGAEKGSLFLFKPEAGEFELAAFLAPAQPPIVSASWKPGEGVAGKVFAGKDPVLVSDIARDTRFEPNGYTHYRSPSFISIPLLTPLAKPLGLINLSDRRGGEKFAAQDLQFASVIAAYACIIANNLAIGESLIREKQFLEEQKELLSRYSSVGKLAAGIVHEINNPLDGVIRFTNMLLNLQEGNSLPRDYLLEIKSGLAKIENVTRSLLQFSHHVNRKNMVIRNYVDLPKLVEEALIACEARSRGDIALQRDIRVGRRILDMGLSQVFSSVIQNAFDAMPGGGVLEISAGIEDSRVRISFRDSGVGISPSDQEHIFDPFYSGRKTAARPGLGLSKCREIIDRYSGSIGVESAPGKGSVFSIIIPEKFLERD